MAQICTHAFVAGRVQGVWYRNSTRNAALAEGVAGWARNLSDGRVEVLLCGEEAAVRRVVDWLHEGPRGASVTSVEVEQLPFEALAGFDIF